MKFIPALAVCLALVSLCGVANAQEIPDFRLPSKTFFDANTKFQKDRKVFAWYMVCCGPFGGNEQPKPKLIAQYKAEIQMAQSMGIDGFGLDIMQPNAVYHAAVDAMFDAAKELNTGFKLFLECDYGKPDAADYINLMKTYSKHPNYFQVKGRPLLCVYAADCILPKPADSVAWWRDQVVEPLKKQGVDAYFVPGTFHKFGNSPADAGGWQNLDADVAGWGDVADGHSAWQIQLSPIGGGIGALERFADASQKAKKTWMSTVSTHYWVGAYFSLPSWHWVLGEPLKADNSNRNGTYFEHAGGKGLDAQWSSIINVQHPEWVMLLTWNDYNESYMEPIDDYKKYKNGTLQSAHLGWYKPQAGIGELNRYYVQWYKTGSRPKITADSIFYAYVTQSYKLKASKDPRPGVGWGNPPANDSLYVTTALTAPAQLKVVSGATATSYDVAAGITHTVVPFEPGKQSFSLWRNGVQINSLEGEPVVDKIDFYDYYPTTGYVETPVGKK
ncbi:MAG TPA: endo-1,3-alpha-glucanase family glycosylhydrolase [Capsulimonadaceae bacterium]|jgi:glucan endo-1,3-alpha-glucosidase